MHYLIHPKTLLAFLFLFVAAVANFATGSWIQHYLPHSVINPDLLLAHLPYLSNFHTIAEIALLAGLILLILVAKWNQFRSAPYIIVNLALVYLSRALLITLTPLAQTSPLKQQPTFYGLTLSGMFPSGHIALITIVYLLVRNTSNNKLTKNIALLLVGLEGISLLLSHSHYSIDLVGGMMMAYVVYRFLLPYKQKLIFL